MKSRNTQEKVCIKCKCNYITNSNQYYCSKCQSKYYRQYRELHKSLYLYMFVDKNGVQYIGQTTNLYDRLRFHRNGMSRSTAHLFENYDRNNTDLKIIYWDISDITDNNEDLLLLETYLFRQYMPKCNIILNKNKVFTLEELQVINKFNSIIDNYDIYRFRA